MKIQIRTKDDLEKLKNQGISYAWRINKSRLNSITEVEIYNFSGTEKIIGTFHLENSKVLNNGRVAVAFRNGLIESCDFKWIGQYPIKYQSSDNQEAELTEDEKVDVGEELKMTEIEKIAENLKNNFLFQASLGSKELFHSNMLAWILEQKNNEGEFEALRIFIEMILEEKTGKIKDEHNPIIAREENKIDLTIKWKSGKDSNFIFIENKMKSIPTKEQLNEYERKISQLVAESTKKLKGKNKILENEKKVDTKQHKFLLTPFFSAVNSDSNDWKNITYSIEIIDFLKEIKDFEFKKAEETNINMMIEKYISFLAIQNEILTYLKLDKLDNFKQRSYDFYSKNMVQNDDKLDKLISVEEQDEEHYMTHVRSLRLHDLVLKLAHSNLANLLMEEFNKAKEKGGLKENYIFQDSFTNSSGLNSVRTEIIGGKKIFLGIQLQGNQFRHFLSSDVKSIPKNIDLATELFNNRIWFHDIDNNNTLLGNGRSKTLKAKLDIKDTSNQNRIFCEYSKGVFLYFYEDLYHDNKQIPSIEEIVQKFIKTFKYYESRKIEIVGILKSI
jgi:hypothetical protein